MNILVTGMTSAQTREDGTIAGYIAKTLRSQGHDVTVAKPSLAESLEGKIWDHVFVGLAPLHGLGSSSMYGALGLIGSHWMSDRVTLYLDDIDAGKIGSGLRLFDRDNWRLTKPFYSYKREYTLAMEQPARGLLLDTIKALVHNEPDDYPNMLVPAFSFNKAFEAAKMVSFSASQNVSVVDFGDMVEPYELDPEITREEVSAELGIDGPYWATEWESHGALIRRMGTHTWPVVKAPSDTLSADYIAHASGVLIPTGSWHEAFSKTIALGLPIATDWRSQAVMGESFEILPQDLEILRKRDLEILIQSQRDEFESRPTAGSGQKALAEELSKETK